MPTRAPLILVVEDGEDARVLYSRYLTFHGFRVIEAADGEAGVRLALDYLPDLIVMDLGLPRIDGWEATRRLKADSRTQHIPVLALTGYGAEATTRAAAGGTSKFDALFIKPCPPHMVLAKIREMLAPQPQ